MRLKEDAVGLSADQLKSRVQKEALKARENLENLSKSASMLSKGNYRTNFIFEE